LTELALCFRCFLLALLLALAARAVRVNEGERVFESINTRTTTTTTTEENRKIQARTNGWRLRADFVDILFVRG
jgi:hypothetical protein